MRNRLTIINLSFSMILSVLLTVGCATRALIDDEAIIRYQKIQIPNYERSDYEKLLSSENDEIKYNAICNLIEYASNYAKTLDEGIPKETSPDNKLKTDGKDKKAKQIFDAITKGLDSSNENIKAVSLIFITEFSAGYSNKEDLLGLVSQVKTENIRTQYEQVRALAKLSNSKTKIDKKLIGSLLDSRSWLIKSMTYLLLGKISSEDFHKRLIKEYKDTNEEYNKLLIIHAFRESYGPEIFHFLKKELLSSDSEKIRNQIIGILNKNTDKSVVVNWIIRDYKAIENEILQAILNEYYSELASTTGTTFFNQLIRSGQEQLIHMIDQDKFFKALYEGLENEESKNDLVELEMAIQNIDYFSGPWITYKDSRDLARLKEEEKQKREETFKETVLPEFNLLLEKFLEDSKKLFTDAGMNEEETEEATKSVRELLQYLSEEQSNYEEGERP